jgi:ubiquinone/menaquinone biosynthesis C-methylase UbiE
VTLFDRDALRRSYERSAPTYDDRFRALQHEKYAAMLDEELELARGPWLDLGCGTGLLKPYLAEHGRAEGSLVGLDFSHAMLAYARARGLAVAAGGMDALPFRAGVFGAVFAFTVLRIVPEPEAERRMLAEVARVLDRGGVFVVTVLRVNHDGAFAEGLRAAGFRTDAPRPCGQDVGYRCVREIS